MPLVRNFLIERSLKLIHLVSNTLFDFALFYVKCYHDKLRLNYSLKREIKEELIGWLNDFDMATMEKDLIRRYHQKWHLTSEKEAN